MNISHENKVIWWALEESGEDEMSKILENYGFHVENDEYPSKLGLKYDYFVTKSDQFPDYKVLCTIKNPYSRVFSLFLRLEVNNTPIKKKFLPILREKFNYFVDKSLISNKLVVKPSIFLENETPDMKYFEKWTFNDKIPDYFVRIEHFYEDLNISKIELDLITGRNHQIRAHMEYMKTPVLNDTLYNASKNHIIPENSIALHSAVLKFTLDNDKYSFSSEVPSFFNRVIDV